MTDLRVRLYVLMLAIIAIGVIWVVGSGDAAQIALQDVVYSKGIYAQAEQATDRQLSRWRIRSIPLPTTPS